MRRTPFCCHRWLLTLALSLIFNGANAQVIELITPDESALPDPRSTRGLTRNPAIAQILPSKGIQRSPLQLKLEFKAHGGARIDPNSVEFTYLKNPMVDLTSRLKSGISERGVLIDALSLPPGLHRIRVRVADSQGREIVSLLEIEVAP